MQVKNLVLMGVLFLLPGGQVILLASQAYAGDEQDRPPCSAPGQPNLSGEICKYTLEVTDVDEKTGMLKGKVPESVLNANWASGAREGKIYDHTNYPRTTVYTFYVDDASGIAIGDVLEFHNLPSSMTGSSSNALERGKGNNRLKRGKGNNGLQ